MYRLVVAVVQQQQQQDSHLLSRVVGTSQRFLENWGRSRVEEWEENQIGLHVKDLVTLFIRNWWILLDLKKEEFKKERI